jgi:hypothetical protein
MLRLNVMMARLLHNSWTIRNRSEVLRFLFFSSLVEVSYHSCSSYALFECPLDGVPFFAILFASRSKCQTKSFCLDSKEDGEG